jgi:hypothetical protein
VIRFPQVEVRFVDPAPGWPVTVVSTIPREVPMLILLARPVIAAVAFVQRILQAVAPSNVLITRVRRAGPSCRGGATLAVLALLLLMAFRVLTLAISSGAPGWLNLLVLVLAWDTIKFAVASCLEAFD